jgi:hypothetical protein
LDRKLSAEAVGAQPTYAEVLRYADAEWPRATLVAVANADVVLRGADRLDARGFAASADTRSHTSKSPGGGRPLALVLSVTAAPLLGEAASSGERKSCGVDQCGAVAFGWSWDVHVYETPLSPAVNFSLLEAVAPHPVYMNAMGAENRVGWMLHRGGYELRNPCVDVVAEHWHCAAKTHAKPAQRAGGGGGRSGNRSRGQAAKSRVDAAVASAEEAVEIQERLNSAGYRHETTNPTTTRFFWVPRAEPGGGRGVHSRSSGSGQVERPPAFGAGPAGSTAVTYVAPPDETNNFNVMALRNIATRQRGGVTEGRGGGLSRRQIARQQRSKERGS